MYTNSRSPRFVSIIGCLRTRGAWRLLVNPGSRGIGHEAAALIGTLLLYGCQDDAPPAATTNPEVSPRAASVSGETTVLGYRIELVNSDPCVVRYGRGGEMTDLRLGLSPPCTLHRNADGTVRVRPVKGLQALLVQRSTPAPERPGDCDTHVQALVVAPESVRSSTAVSRVAMCLPFQWDDVMFIGLVEATINQSK